MRKDGGKMCDRDAKCPFFRRHTRNSISCESPIDGSGITINFAAANQKAVQYAAFCCRRYKNCEIYQMDMNQYTED